MTSERKGCDTIIQNKGLIAAVSAAVVCCLIMTAAVPAVNSNCSERATEAEASGSGTATGSEEIFNYVSVGDSMTCGYGMNAYFNTEKYKTEHNGFLDDIEGTYAQMFEQYLKSLMGEDNVNHTSFSAAALSFAVMNYLLNGHVDSEVTEVFFEDHKDRFYAASLVEKGYLTEKYLDNYDQTAILNALRQFAKDTMSQADLITLESHYDYGYAMSEMYSAFSEGRELNLDFSSLIRADALEMYNSIVKEIIDALEKLSPGITETAAFTYVTMLVKTLAYVVVSYCVNLDGILSWLHANNPDAKVIVMDAYSTAGEMSISVGDIEIPIGKIVGITADMCNTYTEYLCPYALEITTVESETPAVFGDCFKYADSTGSNIYSDAKNAFAYSLDPEYLDESVVKYLYSSWGMPHEGYKVYDYYDQKSNYALTAFMHKVFNSTSVPATEVFSIMDFDFDAVMAKVFACLGQTDCTYTETEDSFTLASESAGTSVTLDAADLFCMWVKLKILYSWAIMSHVSYDGHQQLYENLVKTVEENEIFSKQTEPSEDKVAVNLSYRLCTSDIFQVSVMAPAFEELVGLLDDLVNNLEGVAGVFGQRATPAAA